jgi:hypothetical protein
MDRDERDKFGTQQARDVAEPLAHEIAERLDLDLAADSYLAWRVLMDFALRLFVAGYRFGVTEAAASVAERFPQSGVVVEPGVPEPPRYAGPLGEGPGWGSAGP